MIAFLTSSPAVGQDHTRLNPANGLVSELEKVMPRPARGLFVCSDPDDFAFTDRFAGEMFAAFENAGFPVPLRSVLDHRNPEMAAELVKAADLIILAGGPTLAQNRFFQEVRLREAMAGFGGVVLGISAGTMNSAETVYVQPELPGETRPEHPRFLPGLGITHAQVLPHYQRTKTDILDGLRLFEDVTYPDSLGQRFLALVDGSYLLCRDGRTQLRGEAYEVADGALRQISREGDKLSLA